MAFSISRKKIPLRKPELLLPAPDPDTPAPYDQVAPGLYPGEAVVQLDTGELVAVAVETRRIAGGHGMAFRGWARVIEEDGQTKRDSAHQEIELSYPFTATPALLEKSAGDGLEGDVRLSREIMLMMLGEPATMIDVPVDPAAPPPDPATLPPGTVVNHLEDKAPLLPVSDDVRANTSIRHAIDLANRATPEVDVAALLRR